MRALQKFIVLLMLVVVVVEIVGCAGNEPRGRKRSSGTTGSK